MPGGTLNKTVAEIRKCSFIWYTHARGCNLLTTRLVYNLGWCKAPMIKFKNRPGSQSVIELFCLTAKTIIVRIFILEFVFITCLQTVPTIWFLLPLETFKKNSSTFYSISNITSP